MSKDIPLTRGLVAIVDDEEYPRLAKHKWCAYPLGHGGHLYGGRKSNGSTVLMHREVMRARRGTEIDHINGDRLDNRQSNLRFATGTQNQANARLRSDSTSGFKGVTWNRRIGHWLAQLKIDGRGMYLGSFADPHEAARAYDEAAVKHFGEFARTNQMLGLL